VAGSSASAATETSAPAAQPAESSAAAPVTRGTVRQAQALLDAAAAYLERNPPGRAVAAFNNQRGPFVQGDLYVFAVDSSGVMLAHGGEPQGLVGSNVMDLRDAAGKPLIREMFDALKASGAGSVDYIWLNRVTNRLESKTTLVRQVGDHLLGVGYYTPRSSAEQARALLESAVSALRSSGEQDAFTLFNDDNGRFVHDDLYVFVIGMQDGKFHAMGANPKLVGSAASTLRDASGKPIGSDMIALAKDKGEGLYEYVWRNPANNRVESKHSYVKRVDGYLLGVGYYTK
jgi:cytochrome c